MTTQVKSKDANRDPITGEPGAHPVGTGIGAAVGGAAAGAAAGTIAGPVGTAVGAAMGAFVGGLAGKAAAETIDPTVEEEYQISGMYYSLHGNITCQGFRYGLTSLVYTWCCQAF